MPTDNYFESVGKQFLLYKTLSEKAMVQLTLPQLTHVPNENSNSIAIIVKHMHGNMLSRWTNFLTTDGEKPWRKRDDEFENDISSRESIMQLWAKGWECLFEALRGVTTENLNDAITIRGDNLTVLDAINRQLAHYAYHAGQIVFAAKLLKDGEWENLSIPRKKR